MTQKVNKLIMNTMQNVTIKHSQPIQAMGKFAYWSICSFANQINSDRTPEGTSRVREGWDG